ncbi:MAG: phycobilisome rod-core linker polypeptide, partial [Gemmatimonadetes bacterium]|nr:phycobilisome rod-core linker polypeptide [Gemmatimonadota bacterium]
MTFAPPNPGAATATHFPACAAKPRALATRLCRSIGPLLLLVLACLADAAPVAAQACLSTPREVVEATFRQVLRKEGSQFGVDYHTGLLEAGRETVGAMVADMAHHHEYFDAFITGKSDSTALTLLYRHLLAREPDAGSWSGYLNMATTQGWHAVISSMLASQEYADRFGDRAVPGDPVVAWDCASAGLAIEPASAAPVMERDLCLTIAIGAGAASECGDLRLAHALPSIRTFNKVKTPVLLYNGQHAQPHPVIGAYVSLPSGAGSAEVRAALILDGGRVAASHTWPGWAAGQERRIALTFNALEVPTGVYGYTFQVTVVSGGTTLATYSKRGSFGVVNRIGSGFGDGWWLSGVERLHFLQDGGIFWVGGDGSYRVYRAVAGQSGKWAAVHVADRPDTLYASTYGREFGDNLTTYERRLPGGAKVVFHQNGQHVATVNRLDQHTHFAYDSQGRLSGVGVPRYMFYNGGKLWYHFHYGNGEGGTRLSRVEAPDVNDARARTVRLGFFGTDPRLWYITDPDNRSVQFRYNTHLHRLVTSRLNRANVETFYGYDAAGKATVSYLAMSDGAADIRTDLTPQETRGLAGAAAAPMADVNTRFDGPRVACAPGSTQPVAGVAGEIGTCANDVTAFRVDRWGAPSRIANALGHATVLTRGDPRFPALVTRSVAPNGLTSLAWHNERGGVDSTSVVNPLGDGRNAVTRYSYDGVWKDFATRVTSPMKEVTEVGYDPATGNRMWQQVGEQTATRVTFGYNPAGYGDGAGLLASVTSPATATTPAATERLLYDGASNLRATISPSLVQTDLLNDELGRVVRTRTPIQGSLVQVDTVVYDVMDRVVETQSSGPGTTFHRAYQASTTGTEVVLPAETLFVRNAYDAEGRLEAVRRWSRPDVNAIDTIITRWRYDAAGRAVAEIAPGSGSTVEYSDSRAYDPAGNAVAVRTRRGHTIRMEYDALNRLVRRTIPEVSFDPFSIQFQNTTETWPFPRYVADAAGGRDVLNGGA